MSNKKQIQILKYIDNDQSNYYFTPQNCVNWYDFIKLRDTFMSVADSERVLGMIDKREVENAYAKDTKFDYTNKEELWLDFIADTGDGFNSTTSVFYTLSREQINICDKNNKDITLQRGNILVMGGDLVYPDASEIQYINRFKGPLRFVFPNSKLLEDNKSHPDLFAIPGNHDWYDGLSAFTRMMCQQKKIGGYQTKQNRSYFSLELKENLLFFGIDNQLEGDLDIPQIAYFMDIINNKSNNNKPLHIILCVAEPSWYNYRLMDKGKRPQKFDNINYFMKTLKNINSNIKFDVVVTGDIHHYAHYENNSNKNEADVAHFITSGGGGAFKHVTNFLDNKEYIDLPNPDTSSSINFKLDKETKYPSSEFSKKHILKNLFFPFSNFKFTSQMMALVAFSTFLFYLVTNTQGYSLLVDHTHTWLEMFCNTWHVLVSYTLSLVPLFLLGLAIYGIIQAVQPSEINKHKLNKYITLKYITAFLAAGLQYLLFITIVFFFYKFYHFNPSIHNISKIYNSNAAISTLAKAVGFIFTNSILSGFLLSFIYGIYLIISYHFWNFSITEASSSNIVEGYNNFLRFKITDKKIHIYVIKIEKTYNWYSFIKNALTTNAPEDAREAQKLIYKFRNTPLDFLSNTFKTNAKEDIKIIDEIEIELK